MVPKITKATANKMAAAMISIIFASRSKARIMQIPVKMNPAAFPFIKIRFSFYLNQKVRNCYFEGSEYNRSEQPF